MKNNPTLPNFPPEPSEESIRDYAFHLYEKSNYASNRDLENWFEAIACLKAKFIEVESDRLLHPQINRPDSGHLAAPAIAGALDC